MAAVQMMCAVPAHLTCELMRLRLEATSGGLCAPRTSSDSVSGMIILKRTCAVAVTGALAYVPCASESAFAIGASIAAAAHISAAPSAHLSAGAELSTDLSLVAAPAIAAVAAAVGRTAQHFGRNCDGCHGLLMNRHPLLRKSAYV